MLVRYHLMSRRAVWRVQVSSEGMKGTELTDFFSCEAKRTRVSGAQVAPNPFERVRRYSFATVVLTSDRIKSSDDVYQDMS
jgi:hypothetical protein